MFGQRFLSPIVASVRPFDCAACAPGRNSLRFFKIDLRCTIWGGRAEGYERCGAPKRKLTLSFLEGGERHGQGCSVWATGSRVGRMTSGLVLPCPLSLVMGMCNVVARRICKTVPGTLIPDCELDIQTKNLTGELRLGTLPITDGVVLKMLLWQRHS